MSATQTVTTHAGSTRANWLMLLFLTLMLEAPDLWAGVRATLDRNSLHEGDTVVLTIEADGRHQGGQPDLSVLGVDFDILGTRSSQQVQIVNGKRSDKTQWHVELEPKRTGTLVVPAIKVGNTATQPLTIEVVRQPEHVAGDARSELFVEVEVEPAGLTPYVQQQILYTVRLYTRLPLTGGTLADPRPEQAIVERLGKDIQYQTTLDGQRYQVIERHYAIFPEQSGPLTIPPVSFTGRVATRAARSNPATHMGSMLEQFFGGNPFDDSFFSGSSLGNPGKRVRTRGQPVTLDVKPRPASYTGSHWLPGEQLELRDSWVENSPEFRVGEPVTRTITIEARGLAASQLPEIKIPEIAGMRVYPEQPVSESRTDGTRVYGHSEQSIAFVPSRAGRSHLPEIRLTWWDVKTGREAHAVLPAWEVNVLPATGENPATPAAPRPVAEQTVHRDAIPPTTQDWTARLQSSRGWLAGIAGLILLGLLVVWRRLRGNKEDHGSATIVKPAAVAVLPDSGEARRTLQSACKMNDPQAAARALLDWAVTEWPGDVPRNLGAIAKRLGSGGEAIRALDQQLYAPAAMPWDGEAFWNILKQGLQHKTDAHSSAEGGLAPLYPEWKKLGV